MSRPKPIPGIVKRDGTIVQYDRRRIQTAIFKATTAIGRPDPRLARDAARLVEAALIDTYGREQMPTVEDIQDIVERILLRTEALPVAHEYMTYRHAHAKLRAARVSDFGISENIPYRKIYEVLRWNLDHGCDSVAGLNRLIARGKFAELVAASNRRYEDDITRAADLLTQRRHEVRLAIVAGPSSSGKTTTTLKLSARLAQARIGVRAINIDHYFFDLVQHPRDEFGDYDYETPQALDLDLINRHLEQLLAGRAIRTPHYDFKTGKRTLNVHPLRLRKSEVLLIDSLHGLHPSMTARVPAGAKFKLYIETLGQFRGRDGSFMRWADHRLLRRMIRDRDHRNQQPIETLGHWHYVRRSELRRIIPCMRHADYIVNTALPYELPLLKRRLFRYLVAARQRFADDPKRLDAHIRANRVFDLLEPIRTVRDESVIPPDALVREFIGGSSYVY